MKAAEQLFPSAAVARPDFDEIAPRHYETLFHHGESSAPIPQLHRWGTQLAGQRQ